MCPRVPQIVTVDLSADARLRARLGPVVSEVAAAEPATLRPEEYVAIPSGGGVVLEVLGHLRHDLVRERDGTDAGRRLRSLLEELAV